MIQKYFDTLIQATRELEWIESQFMLEKMESVYAEKLYFIAFIGAFSAGKSYLINNLLKRDFLPKGTMETTPLLTYIRYGNDECVKLHYIDSAIQIITIPEVSELIQRSERWNIDSLEYMEVFLNDSNLKNGLVILDTPGINTVIQRHEQLLATSLTLAAKVIYVLGNAPSAVDAEKLKILIKQGFDVSIVRTHCDEIRSTEETIEEVMASDEQVFSACGCPPNSCVYVSNLPDSKWYSNISILEEQMLSIGSQAEVALESAYVAQLKSLTNRVELSLAEKCEILNGLKKGDDTQLQQCRDESQEKIRKLELKMKALENELLQKTQKCMKDLENKTKWTIDNAIEDTVMNIMYCDDTLAMNDRMSLYMKAESKKIFARMINTVDECVAPFMKEINHDLDIDIDQITLIEIPQLNIESYAELVRNQDDKLHNIMQELVLIKEKHIDIEKKIVETCEDPQSSEILMQLKELEQEALQCKIEYEGMPPYEPVLLEVTDEKPQPSQIAKSIGNLADWALLVLPGTVVASGASKVASSLGKVSNVLKEGDFIKDAVFVANNVSKTKKQIGKAVKTGAQMAVKVHKEANQLNDGTEATSFLDYFTIQHWADKVGRCFDRSPRLEVDQEYEKEQQNYRRSLIAKQEQIQKSIYEKKCQANLYSSEQKKLLAYQQSLRIDEQDIQNKLKAQERVINTKAYKQALDVWKKECANIFRRTMQEQTTGLLSNYLTEVPERLNNHYQESIKSYKEILDKEQAEFNKLQQKGSSESAIELARLQILLQHVRELV